MLELIEKESNVKSAGCVAPQTPEDEVSCKSAAAEGPCTLSEGELVALALKGDAIAFGQLIKRHESACLSRAMLILRNRGDAEDEVQNACWKAFQYRDQFRGEGSFAAWLTRIVENQCLMRIRQQRNAHFLHLDQSTDSDVKIELVGQTKDPEDQMAWAEVVAIVRKEVSRIPPLLRQVMLLRDIDQLPMPDVAVRLGISVPAAKSRLMRARVELRTRITKHCGRKGQGTLIYGTRPSQLMCAYARG
jgi:RNA polymerase sigma-70 factor, ECF subfamily